jgi:hypothetical protein
VPGQGCWRISWPGYDEIGAIRSHIILRAPGTVFCPSLRCAACMDGRRCAREFLKLMY